MPILPPLLLRRIYKGAARRGAPRITMMCSMMMLRPHRSPLLACGRTPTASLHRFAEYRAAGGATRSRLILRVMMDKRMATRGCLSPPFLLQFDADSRERKVDAHAPMPRLYFHRDNANFLFTMAMPSTYFGDFAFARR